MKNVLVLYYSQSGQLGEILENLVAPLESDENCFVTKYQISPENEYKFPWNKKDFFQVFPESYLQIVKPNNPIRDDIKNKKYDLIILGYTVWYLSPSIPMNSFLQGDEAKALLNNTPVVTVNGSRNMWILTQEKVKKMLVDCKAQLVGNIAFVDRNWNHISVITIVHWMMGGKKTRYLGIFPKPGVSKADIDDAGKFGRIIKNYMYKENYEISSDFDLLLRFILKHELSYTYLRMPLVDMLPGGISTRSFRTKYILNKEVLRSCRENGIYSNWIMMFYRMFLKLIYKLKFG